MSTTHVICAMIEVEGCRAEIAVNGFPVAMVAPPAPLAACVPVQQFLLEGSNAIELLLEPGRRPTIARSDKRELERPGASAVARLVRLPDGVWPKNADGGIAGEMLCETAWKAEENPSEFPQSLEARVVVPEAKARWRWQDAPELELNDALIDEARGVLDQIVDVVERGDGAEYNRIVELSLGDWVRAYPVWTEVKLAQEHERFVEHYRSGDDPVAQLRRQQHDFRLVAGGRVLSCVDRDYVASLRLRDPDDGTPVPQPLFLARIDGQLRVVR